MISIIFTYHFLLILIAQAEIYESEGNEQQTYLLLFRHAQLVLRNLSAHPDARQPQNHVTLSLANKEVEKSLMKLEVLKPRLNKRYERYEQLLRDRDIRQATTRDPKTAIQPSHDTSVNYNRHLETLLDPAMFGTTEALTAEDNKDLAVKLARREISRRATAKRAVRQAGISEEEEQEVRTAGLWGSWEEAFTENDQGINQDTLSKELQGLHLQLNKRYSIKPPNSYSLRSFEQQSSHYHYPSIPEKSTHQGWPPDIVGSTSLNNVQPRQAPNLLQGPQIPPKDPQKLTENSLQAKEYQTDDLEQKIPARSATASPVPNVQPSTFTFKPSAYLENGTPLRTIFLPPDLRSQFLSLALPNTRANLETCGVLCGTLISNALFVSKLVIPDQESTSDTCETVNEDRLFEVVDGEDLMVLGWIHTHPTQTCFMSSRDLHTHAGYQAMMPESIAIVCAPSKGEYARTL